MIDIKEILSHEIKSEISKKQLAYIFTKFLLAEGSFKEFVKEFIFYHNKRRLENLIIKNPKDAIFYSIENLKLDNRPIREMLEAYSSAFDWWDSENGAEYWYRLSNKWRDTITSLPQIYVK